MTARDIERLQGDKSLESESEDVLTTGDGEVNIPEHPVFEPNLKIPSFFESLNKLLWH